MSLLFSAATALYHGGIRIASGWNPKARKWIAGREGQWERIAAKREALRGCLWMHCASVGEFEQGRPVLEAIKAARPDLPVLLTFFSPSGYEARKDFPLATHVDYLPPDSRRNAERLQALVTPSAAIFVKYEFWYEHLHTLQRAGVPVFLVSAVFRKEQPFFRWYGAAWRSMLDCFQHIYTQDEASLRLLQEVRIAHASIGGDTRFDRVAAIAAGDAELPEAARFRQAGGSPILVCGSTWPADETLIAEALTKDAADVRTIIAPHEPDEAGIASIARSFPAPVARWSGPPGDVARTLVVDHIGSLARLYHYADIVYVGGGFGDGIHSVLEAAAWGKPVICGPRHRKFPEVRGLIRSGAAFEVTDADGFAKVLRTLLTDQGERLRAGEAAARYVRERTGATARTVAGILPFLG